MKENWKDDNCAAMKSHYAVYSVPEAAALWCGVEKDQIDEILSGITQLSESGFGRGVWLHDDVPCLEPRSRAIADAILSDALAHGREDGNHWYRCTRQIHRKGSVSYATGGSGGGDGIQRPRQGYSGDGWL